MGTSTHPPGIAPDCLLCLWVRLLAKLFPSLTPVIRVHVIACSVRRGQRLTKRCPRRGVSFIARSGYVAPVRRRGPVCPSFMLRSTHAERVMMKQLSLYLGCTFVMHNGGSVAGAVRALFFVAFGLLTHHDDSTLSLRAWYACSRCLGGPVRLCCFPVSLGDISGDRGHSLKPLCFFLYPDQVRFFLRLVQSTLCLVFP